MTKWICKSKWCSGRCTCDILPSYVPHRCLVDTVGSGWEMVGRDCTTEEEKDELTEGIDWRMTTHYNVKRINDLEKKVEELITAGQGQMTRIQELEQMLQNHIHYIAGTTGKSARREK